MFVVIVKSQPETLAEEAKAVFILEGLGHQVKSYMLSEAGVAAFREFLKENDPDVLAFCEEEPGHLCLEEYQVLAKKFPEESLRWLTHRTIPLERGKWQRGPRALQLGDGNTQAAWTEFLKWRSKRRILDSKSKKGLVGKPLRDMAPGAFWISPSR